MRLDPGAYRREDARAAALEEARESYLAAGGVELRWSHANELWYWREAAKLWRRKAVGVTAAEAAHAWQVLGARR